MAEVLLTFTINNATYRVLRNGHGRLLVQEQSRRFCRSYRITKAELEQLQSLVLDTYHQARLRRKARKRANGGDNGDQLVPCD